MIAHSDRTPIGVWRFAAAAGMLILSVAILPLSSALAVPQDAKAGTADQKAIEPADSQSAKPDAAKKVAAKPDAEKPAAEKPAAKDEPQIPITLQPYVVRVELGLSAPGSLRQTLIGELRAGLQTALQRMYGASWQLQVVESEWLNPASEAMVQRLQVADLLPRYPESEAQKVLCVAVESRNGEWQVACREYDTRVQDLSPVRTATIQDRRAIDELAASLARDSFRPVLVLAEAAKGTDVLEFLLQAGELPPPDPTAAQIAAGDVLRPFVRHMERRDQSKLRTLQRLDLTYIRVTKFDEELTAAGVSADDEDVTVPGAAAEDNTQYLDRGRVSGVIISHGVAPFGGRSRFAQQVALRQRPLADSSRVQLVLSKREDRPLVCYRVEKVNKLRYKETQDGPPVSMVTDREGSIELIADSMHPTCWLYVYSGNLLLARVPYAPGLLEQDVVRLPDDSIRLGVEGELYLFRDQLVDVVAQRAVFKGLAKKAAANRDSEKLEAAVKQLDALPGRRQFEQLLNSIRVPAIARAKELKNRGAERNVDRLCTAMAESLTEFFNADKQLKELSDIDELRRQSGLPAPAAPAGQAPPASPGQAASGQSGTGL